MAPKSPALAKTLLALICLAAFSLMLDASRHDAGIMDELAHIPSGYGYARYLDYRLNPEHPPLLKAASSLPLLLLDLNFPTDTKSWQEDVNGQWDTGRAFLYQSGNDADQIIHLARLAPMLLTLLLIILIYLFARQLMGPYWALLPAALFAFSPTVLAHGHYVTTDIAAAFGILISTFYFLKFLYAPSKKHFWLAALAFGVAQLCKFSAVLLIPFFIFLPIAFVVLKFWHARAAGASYPGWEAFTKSIKGILWVCAVFIVGYALIVYPIYALFTVNYPIEKQASDTQYILRSYANGPTPAGGRCHLARCLADLDIWMSGRTLTRPAAQYLLGVLMVTQRAAGGNTNYFLGKVFKDGSRWYFPTVYLLKESLPMLIMSLGALLGALLYLFSIFRKRWGRAWAYVVEKLDGNFSYFAIGTFVVLYWGYSIRSPLNIGYRHLMPTIPFIYILTVGAWRRWVRGGQAAPAQSMLQMIGFRLKQFLTSSAKSVLLGILVVWVVLETLIAAPYFLSYFNELGGGVWGGYRHVTDSNYDWGQDFMRLKTWLDEHPEVDKIAVDYFGAADPNYYLGDRAVIWSSAKGSPADQGIHWAAISINSLEGSIQPVVYPLTRQPQDEYRWLTGARPQPPGLGEVPEPDARAGTSIFIYHLP